MYSYSGRGWKSTPSSSSSTNSSSSSCSAGQSPAIAAAASPDRCCSKSIAEDEDEVDINSEEKDVAAPLPTSNETSSATSRHMKTKNTSAKDKRRLREKRRSTGVASLTGQEADEETTRNTSFNETAAAAAAAAAAASPDGYLEHHQAQNISQSMIASDDAMTTQHPQQPILSHNGSVTQHKSTELTSDNQTSVQNLSIHDDVQVPFSACARTADVTPNTHHVTTTSSNFTKNLCAKPFEAKRSILKGGGSRPVTAAKPAAYVAGGSVSTIKTSTNHCQSSNEDPRMLVRMAELEKDLDLADDDYLRLEEENRALGRALAQLSSTNATD